MRAAHHFTGSPFTHRPVPGGDTVSFCNQCFETIATSHWEAELDRAEQRHVCNPYTLDYWEKLRDGLRDQKFDPSESDAKTKELRHSDAV